MDAQIAQFTEVTGATAEQAQFFLQSANGDLETAMSTFFESGGAAGTGAAAAAGGEDAIMDDDDDFEPAPSASQAAAAASASTARTLGGDPVPVQPAAAASSSSLSSKKKSEMRSTQKRTFGTLGSLARDQADSDDEDKGQDFYTGGEKSGLSVEDPNKKKKPQGDGEGGPNELVRNLLKKAAEGSAARGEGPSGEAAKPKAKSWFSGGGNTLGSEDTPSQEIPDPNQQQSHPASQGPGALASRLGMLPQLRNLFGGRPSSPGGSSAAQSEPEDLPSDWEDESVTRHLTLWKDGFSVEDGPLMRYDDPKNMETLRAIQEGAAPQHILNVRFGQQVELRVAQRTGEDYVAPPPKPMKAFSGGGQRLGAPTPAVSSSAPKPAPAPAQAAPSKPFEVDQSKPVTNIQIRLGDGSRQTARFNHDHTIRDIRNWINAANPGMASRQYVLMTTFPNKDLDDENATVKESGAAGAVVVQRMLD